jgi:hypothetical protein
MDKGKGKAVVPQRRLQWKRWKHRMVLPLDARDVSCLWEFVAAHEEGAVRKTRCLLAEKARVRLATRVSVREVRDGRADWRGPLMSLEDLGRRMTDGLKLVWTSSSFTGRDLEDHYVGCAHRMSAHEALRVYALMERKYRANPVMGAREVEHRLRVARNKREWLTRGLVRERGQRLLYESMEVRPIGEVEVESDSGGLFVEKEELERESVFHESK